MSVVESFGVLSTLNLSDTIQMLFTWDTTNLCIVFRWWRIEGLFSLLVSLALVVILAAGYELVREASRRYEAQCQEEIANATSTF